MRTVNQDGMNETPLYGRQELLQMIDECHHVYTRVAMFTSISDMDEQEIMWVEADDVIKHINSAYSPEVLVAAEVTNIEGVSHLVLG